MKRIVVIFLTVVTLAACQPKPVTGTAVDLTDGSYNNITADELNAMLQGKDFLFVNVHIPSAGNIAGTDVSIPYNEIGLNLAQLPSDKDAKIVLYCRSGHMSQIAAAELVGLAYTNIWNLEGGMAEWEQAGFELEK